MSKYVITMDLQVLNHLGLNLYSSMPAVISEVVANAWDADAKNVHISINNNDKIIILDDGCGMDLQDINEKFLRVGYGKRNEKAHTPLHNRKFMGRKGIGKLSLFSIAHNITILSNKNGEKNALHISTIELDEAIKRGSDYKPTELDVENVDFEHNGTKIILQNLKKRTLHLGRFLKRRLARRFSVIGDEFSFNVYINDEKIKIEDREYISKAQYIWMYGTEDEHKQTLEQINQNVLRKSFIMPNVFEIENKEYKFTGWLATSEEPNALKDEDESINRIAIMVRGKMAKEDILNECGETGLYAKYVFGEISADFLDVDDEDDITTSNRQNFFEDDERYLTLFKFIKEELRKIKNNWIDLRNKQGTAEAQKIEVVKEWYVELGPDDKKAAQKLFGKINQLTVQPNEKEELIRHGILAFETLKLKTCLSEFDSISPEDISVFIQAAEVLNSIEATFYFKIVYERLTIIKKLKEITDENALEKVVQTHLAQNLWLLDPSWDRGTELPAVEQTIMKQLGAVIDNLTQEEKDARLDIRYKKASNRHVIIELKRAARIVKHAELQDQIMKYHNALNTIMLSNGSSESFEIIVLLGRTISNLDKTSVNYRTVIKTYEPFKARIMYYDELIINAEKMYGDFIEKNIEADNIFKRFISSNEKEIK